MHEIMLASYDIFHILFEWNFFNCHFHKSVPTFGTDWWAPCESSNNWIKNTINANEQNKPEKICSKIYSDDARDTFPIRFYAKQYALYTPRAYTHTKSTSIEWLANVDCIYCSPKSIWIARHNAIDLNGSLFSS